MKRTNIYLIFALLLSCTAWAQQPKDPQLASRYTQVELRKMAAQGGADAGASLKKLALQVNGSYEPTQAIEAYLDYLGKQKNPVADLKAFLNESPSENSKIKTMDLLIKKDPQGISFAISQFPKASRDVAGFIAKKLFSTARPLLLPALTAMAKASDEAHQRMLIDAIVTKKATWAQAILSADLPKVKTDQIVGLLKFQGVQGIAGIWAASAKSGVDALVIGEAISTLSANEFMKKQVAGMDRLAVNQQIILMVYGSYRQWSEVKTAVWRAVQSNAPTREAGYYCLPKWAASNDFDIIASKLSSTDVAHEIKALQAAMTQILKLDANTSKGVTKYAKAASKKANWVPFVQEVENLAWLYELAKSTKSDEAISALVKINAKASSNETQQVLRYRNALELTQNKEIRELIYRGLGRCASLQAMWALYQGLKEPNSKSTAADGLAAIYVANPEIQGQMTREWVQEGFSAMSDPQKKEAIRALFSKGGTPTGFYSMFNGQDLRGWKGLVDNPVKRRAMSADTLAKKQIKADNIMRTGWYAKDDELHFTGHGENLCSVKDYQDFDMWVDWKIEPDGDAGIYLRGSPQVQIWDIRRTNVGAQVGSGGLYNNIKNPKNPFKVADNPINDWNTFHIIMKGERVTVYLNGELVVDNTVLENYWDRKLPIFVRDAIELQAHGNHITYRNIYVKELTPQPSYELSAEEKADGFETMFDGSSLFQWTGNTVDYVPEKGELAIYPKRGGSGNLYTKKEYGDFHMKFEFQLTPGANNGLGIRAPLEGDAAYVGMELQILDNTAPVYAKLQPYQYHGSVYGIIPAKMGFLKPVGEWNQEEVIAVGNQIKVIVNGEVIVDGDIAEATKNGTPDHKEHPGLFNKTGHIGFLGHGSELKFRNLRIKEITAPIITKKKKKSL
jgi:hypothetical protein